MNIEENVRIEVTFVTETYNSQKTPVLRTRLTPWVKD